MPEKIEYLVLDDVKTTFVEVPRMPSKVHWRCPDTASTEASDSTLPGLRTEWRGQLFPGSSSPVREIPPTLVMTIAMTAQGVQRNA